MQLAILDVCELLREQLEKNLIQAAHIRLALMTCHTHIQNSYLATSLDEQHTLVDCERAHQSCRYMILVPRLLFPHFAVEQRDGVLP